MRVLGLGVLVWALASLAAPSPPAARPAPRREKAARPQAAPPRTTPPRTAPPRTKAAGANRALPAAAQVAPPRKRPQAEPGPAAAAPRPRPEPLGSCTAALTARRIAWRPAARPGIAHAVEITGPLGGVQLSSPSGPLVIDCSLAVSLDEAGRYLRGLGVTAATFSSAYSRRFVRGTNRPSKHSYGLAIDVAAFSGPKLGALAVERDYEQGLGDDADCLGRPLTQGGATLKLLQCQLARSGLFHLVLTPDYDDAHHDHFHLEARPWAERAAVRAPAPAIY